MAGSRIDVVRELLERFNRDDVDAILELIHEDFVAEIPPSLSAEPDVYRGHAGVRRYIDGFAGMIEDVRFDLRGLHEEGDHVIADLVLCGRGASSGIEVKLPSAVVHSIEDGKVVRMEPYPDLEAAREAVRRVG